ncbi:MAG TPA: hypothetical protein VGQ81_11455 [Acidobacteriota bacterium]|nr:hypothetical protein [Acidobacteriota bacterium]
MRDFATLEHPISRMVGTSFSRERRWGIIGGIVGSMVGGGAFLIASLVQGERWEEMSRGPYPRFFNRHELMPLDFYFVALLAIGVAFLGLALFFVRLGRYPRTDGFGAALTGLILSSLAGTILFLRLFAVLHG